MVGKATEEAKEIDIWMKLQNVIRFGALTMKIVNTEENLADNGN